MMPISVMLALAACSDDKSDSAPVAEADADTDADADSDTDTDPNDEVGFIELVDPLDEPEHYCFDVVGQGKTLQLDSAAQVHTCKDPKVNEWDDQWFRMNTPEVGMISLEKHARCVEAAGTAEGSEILFEDCDATEALQSWTATKDGRIGLADTPTLCWAVTEGKTGEPAGGVSNLHRGVALETCASVDAIYATWAVPGGSLGSP
jgi:hypothetical protein